jgi:hypothetical protein
MRLKPRLELREALPVGSIAASGAVRARLQLLAVRHGRSFDAGLALRRDPEPRPRRIFTHAETCGEASHGSSRGFTRIPLADPSPDM